jgi:hypothetical protein
MAGRGAEGAGRVSVIIKALNEEARVGEAIASALGSGPVVREVILADSGSTDATVEVGKRYPITIVQLEDPALRSCGAGAQLGWPFASGEYVYVLDGDMRLHPELLRAGVERLDAEPELAGVAGLVSERVVANAEFRRRRSELSRAASAPSELALGGLYRRAALEATGYLTNPNLHSFEELELGLRLRSGGWRLKRLEQPGVEHFGPELGSLALLRAHWRSRYLDGSGELLRAAWGQPWFGEAVWRFRHLLAVAAWWPYAASGVALLPLTPWPALGALALGVGFLAVAVADGGWRDGPVRFLRWQVHTLAMLRGLARRQRVPSAPLPVRVVQRGS